MEPLRVLHTTSITSSLTHASIDIRDLAAGKVMSVLTHHKKSVRALTMHPEEFTFASGSADNIKQWQLPKGNFIQNMSGHNAIINSLAVNQDNVLVSGGTTCYHMDGGDSNRARADSRSRCCSRQWFVVLLGLAYWLQLPATANDRAAWFARERGWYLQVAVRYDWHAFDLLRS